MCVGGSGGVSGGVCMIQTSLLKGNINVSDIQRDLGMWQGTDVHDKERRESRRHEEKGTKGEKKHSGTFFYLAERN